MLYFGWKAKFSSIALGNCGKSGWRFCLRQRQWNALLIDVILLGSATAARLWQQPGSRFGHIRNLWLCCTSLLICKGVNAVLTRSPKGPDALLSGAAEVQATQSRIDQMFRQFVAMAFIFMLPLSGLAEASDQEDVRRKIGYGLMFSNDLLGDGKDRWRTGSLTSSRLYGQAWQGQAPTGFGELLELRIQGQILAPSNLRVADPTDRPWAGALTVELNSHMQRGAAEIALGAGLAILGPQTQLDEMQGWLHDLVGAPQPSTAVLNAQVGNSFRPLVSAEVGREFALSGQAALRPFVEARAGDETYLRTGVDFTYGQLSQGFLVRESVTGQRYRTMKGEATGLTLTAGADIAYVSKSVFLPEASGYSLEHNRHRARLGLHWQGQRASAFYGLSYLGKEFSSQSEGQLTGSLQVQLRF